MKRKGLFYVIGKESIDLETTTNSDLVGRYKVAISTDCVILSPEPSGIQALLIRRDKAPYKNMWSLPGGFLKDHETLEECAIRKLKDETNVKDIYLRQVHTFSDLKRDPRGRVLTTVYYAILEQPKLSSESKNETAWFSITKLPQLAFDHQSIINQCIGVMRKDILFTSSIFSLLPKSFSLTELQLLAESLLDQKIDKRNFRRKLLNFPFLEETGETVGGKQRPAKLYRFLPDIFEDMDFRTSLF